MSPKASGWSSERPITSASEGELTIFAFPIAACGSRAQLAEWFACRGKDLIEDRLFSAVAPVSPGG
jgi:hypothetical protein